MPIVPKVSSNDGRTIYIEVCQIIDLNFANYQRRSMYICV